jgi:hypothetical protein
MPLDASPTICCPPEARLGVKDEAMYTGAPWLNRPWYGPA